MLRRILALMIKEFLALLKDKRSRMVIIRAADHAIAGLRLRGHVRPEPHSVRGLQRGPRPGAARSGGARSPASPNFRQVATLTHDEEIAPLVDAKQRAAGAAHRPAVQPRPARRPPGPVQVIVDGRNSNTAAILLSYVNTIVAAFNTDWAGRHGGAGPPARLETRAWFNPNLESRWFIVPGIVGLLTLVVTTLVTALSVAREREQGTFDQLLVTPFRPGEILLGKALPGFIIGLFEATLIILIAVFWFQVPLRGSLLTLYVGLLCFLLSTVGMGLMISSLAVTQQQGLLGAFLFLVPVHHPVRLRHAHRQHAATGCSRSPCSNPLRYFLVILRGVFLEGTPFHLLLDDSSGRWPSSAW